MATLKTLSRPCQRGQAVIELALTLPLLLLVVFGIFDFGFMFQRYEVVTNAAREGARVAVLPGYSNTDAENRALAYLAAGGIGGPGSTITDRTSPCAQSVSVNTRCAVASTTTVTLPGVGGGPSKTVEAIRVEVQFDYQFRFVGPLMNLFGGNLGTTRLRSISIMRDEPD